MSQQPEAIRLAAVCDLGHPLEDDVVLIGPELLRLHAVELEALELRAKLSQEKEVVAALLAEQDRLQCALNKRHAQVESLTRELYQATNPPFSGKTDSWQAACGKARTERDEARTQVESLQVEVNEQARLNGMGAERELALMAKVEILQAASVAWSPAYTRGPARQSAPAAAVPEEVLPPHTEWRRGDKLRVIRSRAGDPFELGQIVTHADVDGDFAPYCSAHRVGKWAIDATRLEFVSHGITSGDGGEV